MKHSPPIEKITIDQRFNELEAFEYHDYLRDGRQYEISPRKVSAFLKILVKKINDLITEVNKAKNP